MDAAVCPECGSGTVPLEARLELASRTVSRWWRECRRCGWESLYEDVLTSRDVPGAVRRPA